MCCSALDHPGLAPSTDSLPDLIYVPYFGVFDRVINKAYLVQGPVQRPLHQICSLQWANQLRSLGAKRHKFFPGRDKKHCTHTECFAVFRCKFTLAVYQSQHTRQGITAQAERYATIHIASSCFEEQPPQTPLPAKYCVNASYCS